MGKHVLPGLVAGVVFAGLYLVMGIPLLLSLAAAAAGWVGASLMLPGSPPIKVLLEGEVADISRISGSLEEAQRHVDRLEKLAGQVKHSIAEQRARKIAEVSRGILADLRKDPTEYSKARPFLENYLPSSRRVMEQYADLSLRGVSSREIAAALEKAEAMLETLGKAFESQRANLAQLDVVSLEVELKLLESTLKMENLGT